MQKVDPKDVRFMRQALALAWKGMGRVHPNPLVGAIVVKNGRVIGRGAHLVFGGPHAEARAIRQAGRAARGATLYITLEPCAHTGKTPPCAELILRTGITRVVTGAKDPNPLVAGKGLHLLRSRRVKVITGVLQKECAEINRDFDHWIRRKTPYVVVKIAQSLDGKIATRTGESKWITGPQARAFGHRLRAESDAVLVGVNTDDPLLSARQGSLVKGPQPIKVILDSALQTPPSAKIFSNASPGRVILAVTKKAPRKNFSKYKGKGEILVIHEKKGRVDLGSLLKELGSRGIVRVLIEGGAEVIADAMERKLANEFYCFTAPKIIGGRGAKSSVGGLGIASIRKAIAMRQMSVSRIGPDILMHGRF
jgi:diaminohydroxyphosphoribosylaminopyrimidine deaminase/5-amino-6-(5-phosphoribosylamino)uracil reductase